MAHWRTLKGKYEKALGVYQRAAEMAEKAWRTRAPDLRSVEENAQRRHQQALLAEAEWLIARRRDSDKKQGTG